MFAHLRRPDFARLTTTLHGGQADAVPLIELGIHPKIKEALLGRPIATVADDIAFMASMGYDFVKIQPRFRMELGRTKGDSPDRAWASEHEGVIRSMEDIESYPWPRPEDIDYSNFEKARHLLPDGMGIIGQYGDIFTTVWEMMGFENFAMGIYEDPELIDALFDRVSSLILGMFDTMASMEWVGALWFSDDIAYTQGLMVGPDWLREKFFPCLAHIGSLAKARGIPLLYHTDGVLWEVFDDIIATGVKAQHPIEPKAMDIAEVKARVGDRLCLCGNIEVDALARADEAEIVRQVRDRIERAAPGGGYCLGSSNSVPDYAKLENYVAMVKTALEIGRYAAT